MDDGAKANVIIKVERKKNVMIHSDVRICYLCGGLQHAHTHKISKEINFNRTL